MTVLLIDRTSPLTDPDKSAFKDGINRFLSDDRSGGQMEVWEVRDENRSLVRAYGEDICIPPMTREGDDGDSFVARWLRWLYSSDRSLSGSALTAATNAKADLFNNLSDVINQPSTPTDADTRIAVPIARLIQSKCASRDSCNLLIFSDMLDSETKRAIGGATSIRRGVLVGESVARRAGTERGKALQGEYGLDNGLRNVSVAAWGVGRSDENVVRDLPDAWRSRIKAYWTAYFQALLARTSGTKRIIVSDDYTGLP